MTYIICKYNYIYIYTYQAMSTPNTMGATLLDAPIQ